MHAVCGYLVKSTWLTAVKAGNYTGWPMLTKRNVKKDHPETIATEKRTNELNTKEHTLHQTQASTIGNM